MYNELNYRPEDRHPVLLTEPPLKYNATESQKREHKTNRENMIDVMFDKFDVPAVYIGIQPVLSLFGHGLTNGKLNFSIVLNKAAYGLIYYICERVSLSHT